MHILAFENKPTLFAGGQERSLHEILSRLSAQPATEVSLCYAESGELLETSYREWCNVIKELPSRVFQPKNLVQWLRDVAICLHLIRKHNIDLLYCNQYPDTPFPALIKKITGTPLICHLRLPAPSYLSRQYRWGLNNADCLIAISNHTKKTYVEKGIASDKIEVLHNAIDTNYFSICDESYAKAVSENRTKRVLYMGRLCPPKGIEVFIEAAKKILEQGQKQQHDFVFDILGQVRGAEVDKSYGQHLKQQAGHYLGKDITFSGHTASVLNDLHNADLVVVPSLWQEPFGRVIIEAMACGVPVVASEVGGIPEILKPEFSNMLVPPNEPGILSESILQSINIKTEQPELMRKLRKKVIEHFSLDRYIPKISSIFQSQLG